MAVASACGSAAGTSTPVSPWTTASGMPPARVPTTASRIAMASSTVDPSPSVTELMTKRSADFTSLQHILAESRQAEPASPDASSLICFSKRARSSPSPKMTRYASGTALQHVRHRLDQVLLPLVVDQRADVDDNRRTTRQPELAVNVDRRQPADLADVDAVVHDDDLRAGMPSCTRMSRIALEAAMKRSTCRYFQREKEWACR